MIYVNSWLDFSAYFDSYEKLEDARMAFWKVWTNPEIHEFTYELPKRTGRLSEDGYTSRKINNELLTDEDLGPCRRILVYKKKSNMIYNE